MKLKIAFVLAALIPVCFVMQNCARGGASSEDSSDQSSALGQAGNGQGILHGSCINSTGAVCHESYGLASARSTFKSVCLNSAPSRTTNAWTDDGHCGPTWAYKCDTTQSYSDGSLVGTMQYVLAEAATTMQTACIAGGGRWSANTNTSN